MFYTCLPKEEIYLFWKLQFSINYFKCFYKDIKIFLMSICYKLTVKIIQFKIKILFTLHEINSNKNK